MNDRNMTAETIIDYKAMRVGWVFLLASTLIWCIISFVINKEFPTVPFVLVCAACVIFLVTKLVLTRKAAAPNQKK